MDLQAAYESISKFWNQISPILIAHVIFCIAWLWIRKSNPNILVSIEKILKTRTYKRWKKIFDEFSLRPIIPFLSILIVLGYFVILGDALKFLAGGLFSPLSTRYTETDFWQETYNSDVIYQIADLIVYHGNVTSKVYEAYEFKKKMIEEYKIKYPNQYDSLVDWRVERQGKWNRYYQLSIAGFIAVSLLLILVINKKNTGLSNKRLIVVLVLSLISIILTRYQAEQTIEETLRAELSFVTSMLRQDAAFDDVKLDDGQHGNLICNIYIENQSQEQSIETYGDSRHFWISRYLEPFFKREFYTIPKTTELSRGCANIP